MKTTTIQLVALLATIGLAGCAGAPLAPAFKQDVQAQISGRQAAYANCYTSALKGNEALKGDLSLTFVVTLDGQLTQVAVNDAGANDDRLKQCVADATSGMAIPTRPPAPVQVSCALSFQPPAMGGKALLESPDADTEPPSDGEAPPAKP